MELLNFSMRAPAKYADRFYDEPLHSFRSDYMRDRDRIMYCKSFRRLSSKTQVFNVGFDDHTRNRLTHTLEVSQIARTISQYLKLDTDLTEAIALGHDLGHTPFGHVGERVLNQIMNGCQPSVRDYFRVDFNVEEKEGFIQISLEDTDKGFKHNLQSLKVAIDIEPPSDNIVPKGLNLTNHTLFGIKNHSKLKWSECKYRSDNICYNYAKAYQCSLNGNISVGYYDKYKKYTLLKDTDIESWSFEAYVVAWADEIAQRHHDIEDAIEGKLLSHEEAIQLIDMHFSQLLDDVHKSNFDDLKISKNTNMFLTKLSKFIVNFLVSQLLEISTRNLKYFAEKNKLKTMVDFEKKYPIFNLSEIKELIGYTDIINNDSKLKEAHDNFQEDLKNIVLNSQNIHRMDGKAQFIITRLFKAYLTNPQQLPDKAILSLFNEFKEGPIPVGIESISSLRYDLEKLKKMHIDMSITGVTEEIDNPDAKFRCTVLRSICDYISGMTDSYAIKEYENLYQ